jgi:hypothetical protein
MWNGKREKNRERHAAVCGTIGKKEFSSKIEFRRIFFSLTRFPLLLDHAAWDQQWVFLDFTLSRTARRKGSFERDINRPRSSRSFRIEWESERSLIVASDSDAAAPFSIIVPRDFSHMHAERESEREIVYQKSICLEGLSSLRFFFLFINSNVPKRTERARAV